MRGSRITVRAASTKAAATTGQSRPQPQPVRRPVELAKLQPMPKGKPGHINFKRVEPASSHHLLYGPRLPRNKVLNPNHPLANERAWLKHIPRYRSSFLQLFAIPNDLLAHAEIMPPFDDPAPSSLTRSYGPEGRFIRHRADRSRTDVVHMALSSLITKKGVHPSAVIRRTIARRLREAIRLIVSRGAKPSDSGDHLTFIEQEGGEHKWLLPNYSYHIRPTLEVYRTPWPTLIADLRSALSTTKLVATKKPAPQSGSFGSRPHVEREKKHNQSADKSRTSFSSTRRPATSTSRSHQTPTRSYSTGISPEAEIEEDALRDFETSHGVLQDVECEAGIPIAFVEFVDDFVIGAHEADTHGCDATALPFHDLQPHNLIPDAAILDNKYKRYTLHKKMRTEWQGRLSPSQLRRKLRSVFLHNRRIKEEMMAERWGYQSVDEQEEMEERVAGAIAERREPQPSGEDQPWWYKWKHREATRQARRRQTWNLSRGTVDEPSTWDKGALERGWGVPGQEFQHDSLLITRDIGRDEETETSTWVPPQARAREENPWLQQPGFPTPQRDDEGYHSEGEGVDIALRTNTGPRVPWDERDASSETLEEGEH